MKRLKCALWMMLALLCCNLFAQEVNGLFYGEIVPPVSAARKAYALAVYRFDKNNYIFELDGVKSALFFTIPQKYLNGKPHLYKANGRVKKIRVECKTQGIDFVAALEDSPHFQKITLPKPVDADAATYRFTIVEVYPGEKWADTCLNLIIPSGDEPR